MQSNISDTRRRVKGKCLARILNRSFGPDYPYKKIRTEKIRTTLFIRAGSDPGNHAFDRKFVAV